MPMDYLKNGSRRMHWSYKTPLRDIFLASRLSHVTDKLVLVSSNFVTKVKETNVRMFNPLRFSVAKNAERMPLSIEYRTNLESYTLLLRSFVVLAEKIVSTTARAGTEQSEYSIF